MTVGRQGEPEALRFPDGGYLLFVGVVGAAARSRGRRWGLYGACSLWAR